MELWFRSFTGDSVVELSPIIVLAPHADDELLGCGGWLIKSRKKGVIRIIVFVTQLDSVREVEMTGAFDGLKLNAIYHLGMPEFWSKKNVSENQMEDRLIQIIAYYKPALLFVPSLSDPHPDHKGTITVLKNVLKNAEFEHFLPHILHYEIFSPHEQTNLILNITEEIDEKIARLKKFETQESIYRFSEIISSLNSYRGKLSFRKNYKYAEAYFIKSKEEFLK